eukprot:8099-Heterococcus_DN1.PRE.1
MRWVQRTERAWSTAAHWRHAAVSAASPVIAAKAWAVAKHKKCVVCAFQGSRAARVRLGSSDDTREHPGALTAVGRTGREHSPTKRKRFSRSFEWSVRL